MMKRTVAAFLAGAVLLSACSQSEQEAAPDSDAAADLATLFDEHWERNLELNPLSATAIGDYRYNDRGGLGHNCESRVSRCTSHAQ